MNNDKDVRPSFLVMAIAVFGALFIVLAALNIAHATQPSCTGNRHYDAQKGCCVDNTTTTSTTSTTVETAETTTTTLQTGECQVCEPVLPCADPAPCPPVTCTATCEDGQDGHAAPPTIVQVDRCPAPEVMEVCIVRGNGVTVCARAKRKGAGRTGSRKILVPRSIIDQIADRERNYDN